MNGSGSCSADPTIHFGHLVANVFDVLPGFFREPRFCKAWTSAQTSEELTYY